MAGDVLRQLGGILANRFSFTTIAIRRAVFVVLVLIAFSLFLKNPFTSSSPKPQASFPAKEDISVGTTPQRSKTLVVSSMKKDDTRWIEQNIGGWDIHRYITDDATARYTVPKNKGREAMVYLTYMIDNYHALPDLMVFIHGERYQWHNDDPLYDGLYMLLNLQVPHLLEDGYTNLRCVWTLGCPAELSDLHNAPASIDPQDPTSATNTRSHYPAAFSALFPGEVLPPTVGVACCAQFAVTREKIHERPIEDYIRYRDWLLETSLADHVSGRVLEYSWHIIFGQEAVHCPNAKGCYCRVYGYCDLDCKDGGDKVCGLRWPFPPYSSLPKGWPFVGWKGETISKEVVNSTRWIEYANHTKSEGLATSAG